MKLRYYKDKKFMLLLPITLRVERGTEYETDDKELIKELKELGFKEVKAPKEQKEGEE
jgi:hypothetical protein